MEPNGHAVARQLIENDDLIGVHAGQAIRRQAPHALNLSGLGGIAQGIETGSVQTRAGQAIVRILGHQLVLLPGYPLTQQRELRADGAARFLGVGRDPCVDRDSHRCVILVCLCSAGKLRISS